ncbi:MAG: polyubiquitin [Hyperionvirus sp.]|uniref:Polyubiquitin n=1 Tax=Hyperionvirus sp. TaxID=2487770 RepID=A0A3G5A869_9VIRU|nr:MAG: polyubiquitin [Hyperionvirus sp.]
MGAYQIFYRLLTGRTGCLDVCEIDTIRFIKEKICYRDGIPESEMKLLFDGRLLEDDGNLNGYGIGNGCTIHLIIRLRGAS